MTQPMISHNDGVLGLKWNPLYVNIWLTTVYSIPSCVDFELCCTFQNRTTA